PNPLHFGSVGSDANITYNKFVPQTDPKAPTSADAFYQSAYKFNVMGHIQELGFAAAGANASAFKFAINVLANPAFNAWLINSDAIATVSKAQMFYQDWGTLLQSFTTNLPADGACVAMAINLRTVASWWEQCADDHVPDGYPHIWQAAASYMISLNDGALTGQAAWNWLTAHVAQGPLNLNPQYAILPRIGP